MSPGITPFDTWLESEEEDREVRRPAPPIPRRGGPTRVPAAIPVVSIQHFRFDQAGLVRDPARGVDHPAVIGRIARAVVHSWLGPRPITALLLRSHTDERGPDAYNVQLGLRRGRAVETALRAALRRESVRVRRPDVPGRIRITVTTAGERLPTADDRTEAGRSANRRVDVLARRGGPPPRRIKMAPDGQSKCGVPFSGGLLEATFEGDGELYEVVPRRVIVRPRLSLFQEAQVPQHRNHFECGALPVARRLAAIAVPNSDQCRPRVGATSYRTGEGIIRTIQAAHRCLGERIEAIHIFSHGNPSVIPGFDDRDAVGIQTIASADLDKGQRSRGARAVTDIPAALLAENVDVVLHGCNMAFGDDNIAQAIYRHLRLTLANPRFFGHVNSGCASRNNSWREYSNRFPNGSRPVGSIAPIYTTDGACCTPKPKRR